MCWSDASPPRGLASSFMGKWTPILTTNLNINLLQSSMEWLKGKPQNGNSETMGFRFPKKLSWVFLVCSWPHGTFAFSATDLFETFSRRVWGWKLNGWKFETWEPSIRASHKEITIYQSIWEVARQNCGWLFPIWKASKSTQHCSHSILKLLARTCQNRWCTCLLWSSLKQKRNQADVHLLGN